MATNPDPVIIAAKLDQLISNVDILRRCVVELTEAVRLQAHVTGSTGAMFGRLDAIDHVLRTLPL